MPSAFVPDRQIGGLAGVGELSDHVSDRVRMAPRVGYGSHSLHLHVTAAGAAARKARRETG